MAYEWALDLDMDGIRLMSRDVGQWQEVSTVSLDETGFRSRLSGLITDHNVGPDVYVFLPRSQVLYRSVMISSREDASHEIEAVLDTETPYDPNELEFDWDFEGPKSVRVAAVALETLEEARGFVESFGLRVSSFSALAKPGEFPRRPDFGGELGLSLTDFDASDDLDELGQTSALLNDGETASEISEEAETPLQDDLVAADDTFAADSDQNQAGPDVATFTTARDVDSPPEPPLNLDAAAPVIAVAETTPVVSLDHGSKNALDPGAPLAVETSAPRIVTDLPVPGSQSRTGEAEARVLSRGLEGNVLSRPVRLPLDRPNRAVLGIAAVLTLAVGAVIWTVMPGQESETAGLVDPPQTPATVAPDTETTETAAFVPPRPRPERAPIVPFDTVSAPQPASFSVDDTQLSIQRPDDAQTVSVHTATVLPDADTAERDVADITWSEVPLPAVLDVASVLAPFAIDAKYITPTRLERGPEALQLASLAPVTVSSEVAPDLQSSGVMVPPLPKRPGALAGVGQFVPSAPMALSAVEGPGSVQLVAIEPSVGLSELVALPNETPIVVAPDVPTDAPASLTRPATTLAAPVPDTPQLPSPTELAQSLPDERPRARPEGLAPVLEVAAAPSDPANQIPPSDPNAPQLPTPTDLARSLPDERPRGRPEGLAPVVEVADVQPEPVIPAIEANDGDALPRPTALAASLTDRRPAARTLPPAPATVTVEDADVADTTTAVLAALETDPLADFRPSARPGSAQDAARASSPATTASDLAVATSSQPRTRPAGLVAAAQAARIRRDAAALAAVRSAPAPDTSAAISAALSPQDDEDLPRAEPRNSASMAFPTDVSVARQATIEDAIRLNRINLIGVYGVPSDRRALVRLPSGRYVKVKVGDRVDGGNVAAIGDNRLRYTKGGRTVTLEIPSG